jgi:putative PIN family toxin of toxin-antitoxin system
LRNSAELVDVHSVVEVCRDPKDNFLLALVKDGNADYLITGDDDLLVLETFEKTKIVTLTDFEAAFSS